MIKKHLTTVATFSLLSLVNVAHGQQELCPVDLLDTFKDYCDRPTPIKMHEAVIEKMQHILMVLFEDQKCVDIPSWGISYMDKPVKDFGAFCFNKKLVHISISFWMEP